MSQTMTPQVNSLAFDIDEYLKQLPLRPGVYRMLDTQNEVLYVGKAVNLKSRVSSYFRGKSHNTKTQLMVSKVASIEITLTHSESEALLLENTLIKRLKPPYNISLRDDKSYPYVYVSDQHDFPAMQYVRGGKKRKGRYFGPYTSAGAVRESLNLMQRIFRIRQCEDAFFANRKRPCLQFQIDRCSGPCTGEISHQDYADDIRHATMYLEGKNQQLLDEVSLKMNQAAEDLKFESAAQLRDQLGFLRQVQEQQHVVSKRGNLDVFAAASSQAGLCIHQLMVRSGRVIGSKNFYPRIGLEEQQSAMLSAFLGQYYLSGQYRDVPDEVLVSDAEEAQQVVALAIAERVDHGFKIISNVRGPRAQWLRLAQTNADQALLSYVANKQTQLSRFAELQEALGLPQMPERLECFDISHSSGEATVASCVVFDQGGPKKSDYRTFNIEGITPGDDYAAMSQAITRRYTRLKENQGVMPDLLIIDGGKGQLTQAIDVLSELQLQDLYVLGVAKGETRKAGFERLFNGWTGQEIVLPEDSSALHLLQHIRDESHRFAITGHRARRNKKRTQSNLQQIDGVGPKRRQALLSHFGGIQDVTKASVDELAKVKGISIDMADTIYRSLRGEEG
ncbi:MAG: excinuclease ABC subunit UvrC [Gammaproteobacteria bacterium]|nr:excinuclease ABC subunit UvrC [Gammaproteobacteria bacterium]